MHYDTLYVAVSNFPTPQGQMFHLVCSKIVYDMATTSLGFVPGLTQCLYLERD